MGGLGNSMDLPLEPTTGHLHDVAEAEFSGGVVVMASIVQVPDVGPTPALVFRFAKPDGSFYRPIVLVADDDQIAKLEPLVVDAIALARAGARSQGRSDGATS